MSGTENQNISKKASLSRREFLGLAWMGTLGLGLLKLAEVLGKTALPRHPEGRYGGEFEVGSLASLPKVTDPPLAYPEGRFWLIQTEAGLLALHRACTHLDCLVSWDDDAQKFVCPCHGSEFSRQGDCLQGPASRALDRFALRVVTPDGKVIVTSNPNGAPLPVDKLIAGEQTAIAPESVIVVNTANKILGTPIG